MALEYRMKQGKVNRVFPREHTGNSKNPLPTPQEKTLYMDITTIVWPQVNNKEGIQPHPSTENWIKDLLSIALPIRTRASFPLSQSLSLGSFHKPLILLHQRIDRLKTKITEN